jgi:hypothetical protein
MPPYVERIVERLRDAEEDLERDVEEQQRRWHYQVHRTEGYRRELPALHHALRREGHQAGRTRRMHLGDDDGK